LTTLTWKTNLMFLIAQSPGVLDPHQVTIWIVHLVQENIVGYAHIPLKLFYSYIYT